MFAFRRAPIPPGRRAAPWALTVYSDQNGRKLNRIAECDLPPEQRVESRSLRQRVIVWPHRPSPYLL
jgi:hypothetical protein